MSVTLSSGLTELKRVVSRGLEELSLPKRSADVGGARVIDPGPFEELFPVRIDIPLGSRLDDLVPPAGG
jgi:hypothetical protein